MSAKKARIDLDRVELVEQYVDNPDWRPEREGEKAFPRKTKMPVNVRESAIATLAHKGTIDAAQAAAADKYRAYYEAAGGAGARAIDFTREAVDGGRGPQVLSDTQMRAGIELKRCQAELGVYNYNIVRLIAGERRSLHEICGSVRERNTTADILRISLTALAVMWGLSMKPGVIHRRLSKSA